MANSSLVIVQSFLRQDLALKYRRSVLGFVWSLLNPILMLSAMTVAFSFLFSRDTGPGGFALHLFACLLPWQCLTMCIGQGSTALISGEKILLQVPIPIWIFPMRRALFAITEYTLSLVALALIVWFVGFRPSWSLLILPLSILCLLGFGYGIAAISSVMVVYYRDTEHLISVILKAWFYVTPVLLPFTAIPESLLPYFKLNPAYYLLQMFDSPITLSEFPPMETIVLAVAISFASALAGSFVVSRFKDEIVFRL
jgi:ABC-type polysaccharide/polyol phosphate export permease